MSRNLVTHLSDFLEKMRKQSWLPYALALLAGVLYFFNAHHLAHTTTSFLDEGLYVYKGWLFATDIYQPFQEYGVWTNHMPLSFLIPGYVQKWFGAGLRTARYFMIFLGLLSQLGLWIVVRRWSNLWWATGAVLFFALNTASIKLYTLAISQGIIACMFMWTLVFTLDRKPRLWRIFAGTALAGLMISTRLNMSFVLPLVLLYIFWQFGFKKGLYATGVGILSVLVVQAFFYPGIMSFWGSWLPKSLTPFLDAFRTPPMGTSAAVESAETLSLYRIALYVFLTLRLHFVSFFGAIATWLLFPSLKEVRLTDRMKAAVFLSVLLVMLLGAHIQNTFSNDRCVSCILLYAVYFDFLGLILLPLAFPFLKKELSKGRVVIIFTVLVITIVGLGFSAYEDVSLDFANLVIPLIRDLYVWSALLHVTQIKALVLFRIVYLSLIVGLILTAFLSFFWLLARLKPGRKKNFGFLAVSFLLIFGFILTPTKILGKGNDFFNCEGYDVIARYEKEGEYLRNIIPAGSTVYWSGRLDAVFLYLPDVIIYPPQLNHVHSLREGGDPALLLRYGLWNNALAMQWLEEADYILSEIGETQEFEKVAFESSDYVQLGATGSLEKCRAWRAVIEIYQRAD